MIEKIKNNKALKILYMAIKAITTFVVVVVITIIFIQRVSNNKFNLCGFSMYTIITESMVPKYQVYDMVIVKEVDPTSIKVGDDVVYLGEKDDFKNKIVTHQVVKIDKETGKFHTKGLANNTEDPLITGNQILGKVIYKSTLLSLISKVVNNPYGFYFVIFVPFAILVVMETIDIINERRILKKKKK